MGWQQLDSSLKLTYAAATSVQHCVDGFATSRALSLVDDLVATTLQKLQTICRDSDEDLMRLHLGPSSGLVGSLHDARERAATELDSFHESLADCAAAEF